MEGVLGCCKEPGDCCEEPGDRCEEPGDRFKEPDNRWAGWEGPKEETDGRECCWPGAWGWLEELAFNPSWAWDLPGSLEPLGAPVARDWPKVVREVLPGADGTVAVCAAELVEGSVEDLGCDVPFSWLFGRPARGLGRDFTCPAGAGLRLLWRPGLFLLPRPGLAR